MAKSNKPQTIIPNGTMCLFVPKDCIHEINPRLRNYMNTVGKVIELTDDKSAHFGYPSYTVEFKDGFKVEHLSGFHLAPQE